METLEHTPIVLKSGHFTQIPRPDAYRFLNHTKYDERGYGIVTFLNEAIERGNHHKLPSQDSLKLLALRPESFSYAKINTESGEQLLIINIAEIVRGMDYPDERMLVFSGKITTTTTSFLIDFDGRVRCVLQATTEEEGEYIHYQEELILNAISEVMSYIGDSIDMTGFVQSDKGVVTFSIFSYDKNFTSVPLVRFITDLLERGKIPFFEYARGAFPNWFGEMMFDKNVADWRKKLHKLSHRVVQ